MQTRQQPLLILHPTLHHIQSILPLIANSKTLASSFLPISTGLMKSWSFFSNVGIPGPTYYSPPKTRVLLVVKQPNKFKTENQKRLQHYQQLGGYMITPIQPNFSVSTFRYCFSWIRVLYKSSKTGTLLIPKKHMVVEVGDLLQCDMEVLTEMFFLSS